jgi:hypothetical protein
MRFENPTRLAVERPPFDTVQSIERQFCKLLERAIGYSGRRNDVAHGFVFAVQQTSYNKIRLGQFPPHTNQWLVVPPAYALGTHIGTVRPLYAYSSTELNALAKNLNELSSDLLTFCDVLQGDTTPGGFVVIETPLPEPSTTIQLSRQPLLSQYLSCRGPRDAQGQEVASGNRSDRLPETGP